MRTGIYCQKKETEHNIRPVPSATGMAVSRQTVYRCLGQIGLYARRLDRCVPLTATHCPGLACSLILPDFHMESSRYKLSPRERHCFGGTELLIWGGIILRSRTDLYVQIGTIIGLIYRDVILEHVRLFQGAVVA
ncbi:HTH_Tnp_Tc3_2 domain-containing protein [Trichonephila clavipes]|nr:HTH_Tnp_Tc3_2 domain-containing protein [Trichonephila clavipes]